MYSKRKNKIRKSLLHAHKDICNSNKLVENLQGQYYFIKQGWVDHYPKYSVINKLLGNLLHRINHWMKPIITLLMKSVKFFGEHGLVGQYTAKITSKNITWLDDREWEEKKQR
jgi:hypothetical protein